MEADSQLYFHLFVTCVSCQSISLYLIGAVKAMIYYFEKNFCLIFFSSHEIILLLV